MEINVWLTESQMEQLLQSVDVSGYVQYMDMDEWNDYMQGVKPSELIDSISSGEFYTGDAFAYMDDDCIWKSSNELAEILEPHIDDIFNDYLHFYL